MSKVCKIILYGRASRHDRTIGALVLDSWGISEVEDSSPLECVFSVPCETRVDTTISADILSGTAKGLAVKS